MRQLCVIGDPIAHSKSPLLHNTMLRALELDGEYEYTARRVPGADTAAFLAEARAEGVAGFNATMPHKEHLVPLMDRLSDDARMYGAVNTVCLRDGEAVGHNTDGAGFLRALLAAGLDPAGRTVLLLGAGGAARAVAPKLLQGGAEAVFICNRTITRAAQLCAWDSLGRLAPAGMDRETLARLAPRCSLAVNCTSLGMEGTGGQFEDLSFVDALPPEAGVFDLIYSPAETALLRRARARGLRTANGLGMLIWQAILALELFLDRELDGPAMARLLEEAMK